MLPMNGAAGGSGGGTTVAGSSGGTSATFGGNGGGVPVVAPGSADAGVPYLPDAGARADGGDAG